MKIYTKSVSVWNEAEGRYVTDEAASEWYEYHGPVAEAKKGGGGKKPKAPDPVAVSQAQTQSNQATAAYNAALNRVNTYTPQGSSTFTQTGTDASGAPIYRQDVTLSPQQQALYDQQQQQNLQLGNVANGMIGTLQNTYANPIDTSSAPQLFGANDLQGERGQVQDALYNRQAAYLDPQWQQRENAFRSQMANQGIVEGSEAWRNALDDQNRARSFDYAQARNDAILAGRGEMEALSNLSRGNRALTLDEMYRQRSQPMNEFNALRSASQVDMPQFSGAAPVTMANTDVSGNYWNKFNADMARYNAQQAQSNGIMGGLFGLGGSLLNAAGSAGSFGALFSDERLKTDIEKVGELPSGPNVYSYEYKGDPTHTPQVGVMAQEVEKTQPEAVIEDPSGFKKVDYAQVLAKAMKQGGRRRGA